MDLVPNICAGPTMDMQIIRDLFSQVIEASTILGVDQAFRNELVELRHFVWFVGHHRRLHRLRGASQPESQTSQTRRGLAHLPLPPP